MGQDCRMWLGLGGPVLCGCFFFFFFFFKEISACRGEADGVVFLVCTQNSRKMAW